MNNLKPNFQVLKNNVENNYMKFELNNVNVATANAIRRIILSDVESVTIDPTSIVFDKNNCPIHDQMLMHRLSFIPLNIDPNEYEDYRIELHDKNDSDKPFVNNFNNDTQHMYIYTDDLIVYKNDKKIDNKNIFVGNSRLLLLHYEQEIKFSCKLSFFGKNEGRKYNSNKYGAIWCPVSQIAYRYKTNADLEGREPSIPEEQDYIGKENNSPSSYIFQIESLGSSFINIEWIINRAFFIIKKKLNFIKNNINNPDTSDLIKYTKYNDNHVHVYIYNGEEHTIGNLLQTKINDIQNFMGESRENIVSYKVPHQLVDELQIIIKNDPKKIKNSPIEVLINACNELINDFTYLQSEWSKLINNIKKESEKEKSKKK